MQHVIDTFKHEGAELFFVGGCVRDKFFNIEPDDYDFATNLKPDEIIALAKKHGFKYHFSENGYNHGTIVVEDFDITTYRKEVSWDGRNATVVFADNIFDDLARRDFTMNAIAKCAYTGRIIELGLKL